MVSCRQQGLTGFINNTIQNRYKVIRHIDSGSQGHIFEVEDKEDQAAELVVKISEFLDSLPKEIQAIERIKEVAAQSNSD